MKKTILILIMLFSGSKAFSQGGWVTVTAPTSFVQAIYANIDFVNENTGYLNRDKMYKSTNGGLNWYAITTTISEYTKIKFFNSGTGYILMTSSNPSLAKTTNSGVNWTSVGSASLYFEDVNFVNENTGYAIHTDVNDSMKSYVYKTTDGCISWNKYFIRQTYPVFLVNFCNINTGYTWGYGEISKTTNAGVNWSYVDGDNLNVMLNKFFFTNENNGWAVTDTFRIAKTTNAGVNWVKQYQLSRAYDIFFLNSSTGWYGFDKVYKTTNAGVSWVAISDTGNLIFKVKFINENTGWCYTSKNKILITHNGGSVFIKNEGSEIPDKFSLSQNYPNPFNPNTKIKFNITKSEFVKITVHDISGKLISTLVNGNLSAGMYSADFDGKNLSSGTYFYRMEAGDFNEVKRMILIK